MDTWVCILYFGLPSNTVLFIVQIAPAWAIGSSLGWSLTCPPVLCFEDSLALGHNNMLILCVPGPISRVCRFSKGLWVCLPEKGIGKQDLSLRRAHCCRSIRDIPFAGSFQKLGEEEPNMY